MIPKEYAVLFNAITDAIEILIRAQQQAEEIVISRQSEPQQRKDQESKEGYVKDRVK